MAKGVGIKCSPVTGLNTNQWTSWLNRAFIQKEVMEVDTEG